MGADFILAPDMDKMTRVAEYEGIDIYTYKEYCKEYISHQIKQEERNKKQD